MHTTKNRPLVILEGNIGAGKSTFLRILADNLNFVDPIFEPTNKWQHNNAQNNLLDLFYQDTQRWAYTFQSYAFITRIQAQLEHLNQQFQKDVQILERSVYCDRYCFAKNCFEMGTINSFEWNIYKEWFAWLAEKYAPKPTGFIYLQTKPETCFQRLQKRSRSEETGISLNYLSSLHTKHEEWLIQKKDIAPYLKDIPILVLDCNKEFENNTSRCTQYIEAVDQFIYTLTAPMPTSHTITPHGASYNP